MNVTEECTYSDKQYTSCVSLVLTPSEMTASHLITADVMAKAFGFSQMMGNILVLRGIGGCYVGGRRAIYTLVKAGMHTALGDLHPKFKMLHKAILLFGVF